MRNADTEEAAFFALVAAEAGIASGAPAARPDVVRVALHDGQVAGFGRAVLPVGEDRESHLDYLVVHESWRGRGVGRALLNDLSRATTLIGVEGIVITAHPSSAGFFDRTAAVRVGTRAAYIGVPWHCPVYHLAGPTGPSEVAGDAGHATVS